jgi:hypothetical protein
VYTPAEVAEVQAPEPPPALPDYEQPPCPDEGYVWTPGYWAFGPGGYYWIPGTWVEPPRVGVLWTPGYWGFVGAAYVFHAGYWGPHVGFYGGINYGHGYGGVGYVGGHWEGDRFAYNRSVTNVNVTVVHNVYNETVVNNITVNKVSYNGGNGGVAAVASADERRWQQEPHVAPTPVQTQHFQEAAKNPALFARANGGHPSIAATPRPAVFNAPGVVGAHGAPAATMAPVRPTTLTPTNAPVAPKNAGATNSNFGNAGNTQRASFSGPKPPVPPTQPLVSQPKPPVTTQNVAHTSYAISTPHQQQFNTARPPPTQSKPQPKTPAKKGEQHDTR